MLPVIPLMLVLLSVPFFAASTQTSSNLTGDYKLVAGMTGCAQSITLSRSGATLPASSISADGAACTGGALTLSPITQEQDTVSKLLLSLSKMGHVVLGMLDTPLVCGAYVIPASTRVYAVSPSESISLQNAVLATAFGDLAAELGDGFTFRRGQAYLIDGARCLFGLDESRDDEDDKRDEDDAGDLCFPASASVTVLGGETRRIDQLRIGDKVHVGNGKFSPVFAWTHHDASHMSRRYVHILTYGGRALTVTAGHFVYANHKIVPANTVRKGDVMCTGGGDDLVVTEVRFVKERGLYNPQTVHGDIIVDGFKVTTYTTAIDPGTAHALLAPLRALHLAMKPVFLGTGASV